MGGLHLWGSADTLRERFDDDEIAMMEESGTYELIHFLRGDIRRLAGLAMEARGEANRLAAGGDAYMPLAEDVHDGSFDDHPAMKRYIELYGDRALLPWED